MGNPFPIKTKDKMHKKSIKQENAVTKHQSFKTYKQKNEITKIIRISKKKHYNEDFTKNNGNLKKIRLEKIKLNKLIAQTINQ